MEWRIFDYTDRLRTAPAMGELVWIMEQYYIQGVTMGYFDGRVMRMWGGSDDCSVTHWAEIDYPEGP